MDALRKALRKNMRFRSRKQEPLKLPGTSGSQKQQNISSGVEVLRVKALHSQRLSGENDVSPSLQRKTYGIRKMRQ